MGYFQIRKRKRGRNKMITTTTWGDIIGAYEEAIETEREW